MFLKDSYQEGLSDQETQESISLWQLEKEVADILGKSRNDREIQELERAIRLASQFHKGRKRFNNEVEISHPGEMARIIFYKWKIVDVPLLAACLLHEVPEEALGNDFSTEAKEIHQGAELVKKLSNEQSIRETLARSDFEAADRLVMGSPNLQSVLLRLADRLHNCRTLAGLPLEKQFEFAQEVVGLYAPVADYLGLGQVAAELNDRALQIAYPDEFLQIHQFIGTIYQKVGGREHYLAAVGERLQTLLLGRGVTVVRLDNRAKSEASILRKRERYLNQGREDRSDLATFSDLTGSRIVVPTERQCRRVLTMLKESLNFDLLEDRTDDYLGERQRTSGYQALHAVVSFQGGPLHEVQILTPEMFINNQWGSASHLRAYEAGGKTGETRAVAAPWQKTVAFLISSSYRKTGQPFHLAPLHSKVARQVESRPEVVARSHQKSGQEYEESLDIFCDYLIDLLREFRSEPHFDNLVCLVLWDKYLDEGRDGLKTNIRLALEEICFFWKKTGGTPEDLLFFLRRGGARAGNILARIANNIAGISNLEKREKNRQVKDFIETFPFPDWLALYHVPWRIEPAPKVQPTVFPRPHRSYLDLFYRVSPPYTK